MKRTVYISLFAFLGILLSTVAHAFFEMWYIGLLLADFERFGLGFSWQQWILIHHALSAILLIAGCATGYRQGVYWWHRLYEL